MKPKHQRLLFVIISMVFLCVGTVLTMSAFRSNLIFFYSPSDLQKYVAENKPSEEKTLRIGGLVKAGSIKSNDDNVDFIITDGNADIEVAYKGIVPNLFREGQGCIAEGILSADGKFIAQRILAKHDEKYLPREVVDALKRSGKWQGGDAQ
ncbi:MAG: cytochrome c maturation protein CcmE [Pseudomonadota bacterium]